MEKELLEHIYDEENSIINMLLEYQEQEEHMLDSKASNELKIIYKNRAQVEKNIKKLLNKNISDNNVRREIINYIENLKQYFYSYKSQYQNYQKRENNFYQFRHLKSPTRIIDIFHFRNYIFNSIRFTCYIKNIRMV